MQRQINLSNLCIVRLSRDRPLQESAFSPPPKVLSSGPVLLSGERDTGVTSQAT